MRSACARTAPAESLLDGGGVAWRVPLRQARHRPPRRARGRQGVRQSVHSRMRVAGAAGAVRSGGILSSRRRRVKAAGEDRKSVV